MHHFTVEPDFDSRHYRLTSGHADWLKRIVVHYCPDDIISFACASIQLHINLTSWALLMSLHGHLVDRADGLVQSSRARVPYVLGIGGVCCCYDKERYVSTRSASTNNTVLRYEIHLLNRVFSGSCLKVLLSGRSIRTIDLLRICLGRLNKGLRG